MKFFFEDYKQIDENLHDFFITTTYEYRIEMTQYVEIRLSVRIKPFSNRLTREKGIHLFEVLDELFPELELGWYYCKHGPIIFFTLVDKESDIIENFIHHSIHQHYVSDENGFANWFFELEG